MDRNYYYEKMQRQRERETSDLWAHPRESREPLSRKQAIRLILRIAFAIIVFSLLALYFI
jgi:hypothetical protein